MTTITKSTIKEWLEEDRPREKLTLSGRSSLTNSELLAIILGSGSTTESAVELSKRILSSVNNNLNELNRLEINQLTKFKGVGPAKAVNVLAALELSVRLMKSTEMAKTKITSSSDIFNEVQHLFSGLKTESFVVVALDRANHVISKKIISSGGVSGVIVDVKVVMKFALDHLCSSLIVAHNHPSGNMTASREDKLITDKIKSAAKLLDLTLLDHLIIFERNYYSFADSGIL